MQKDKIIKILVNTIDEYFETQDLDEKANSDTTLFGQKAILDSMGLVNVIVDIESKFLDVDKEISLTSEKAMSRRNSPFKTVDTLANFIYEQLGEENE